MRQKIEIKVYLPYKMVGELEGYRRKGNRSSFIESCIKNRLEAEEEFSYSDIETTRLLGILHARFPDDQVFQTVIENRLKELRE
jgi:metal-responsive CopG/Arc/MetJ family transcriptional regulator